MSDTAGVRLVECLPEQAFGPPMQQAVLGSGHFLAEEFRFLAAKVAALAHDRCTTVGVVSAAPREGKTTVALGLAAALARASPRRVLLLEADLRRPVLEDVLGLPHSGGVAEWLSGRGQGVPVRMVTPPGFALITGGRESMARPELLGSERMAALVAACRQAFGVVVVDCPPLSPVADAVAIQNLLDGFLLVVRGRYAARQDVARAVTRLDQNRIHGIVFNHHPEILRGGNSSHQHYGREARR